MALNSPTKSMTTTWRTLSTATNCSFLIAMMAIETLRRLMSNKSRANSYWTNCCWTLSSLISRATKVRTLQRIFRDGRMANLYHASRFLIQSGTASKMMTFRSSGRFTQVSSRIQSWPVLSCSTTAQARATESSCKRSRTSFWSTTSTLAVCSFPTTSTCEET